MQLFDELNNANFEIYAANHYRNTACLDAQDFYDDVAKFKYVVRLLRRIYNVFEISAANRMIFYKVDPNLWPALKTFLVYLHYLPENLHKNINIDLNIAKKLKEL